MDVYRNHVKGNHNSGSGYSILLFNTVKFVSVCNIILFFDIHFVVRSILPRYCVLSLYHVHFFMLLRWTSPLYINKQMHLGEHEHDCIYWKVFPCFPLCPYLVSPQNVSSCSSNWSCLQLFYTMTQHIICTERHVNYCYIYLSLALLKVIAIFV